jgi:hypothetical protein
MRSTIILVTLSLASSRAFAAVQASLRGKTVQIPGALKLDIQPYKIPKPVSGEAPTDLAELAATEPSIG